VVAGTLTGRYAGSTWYADEFALDLVEDCVAHVDMDSPGAKGSTEYVDMACWMPEMHGVVSGAIEDATGADYNENRPRRAGDYSFNNLGISGAFTLSSNIPENVRDTMRWHTVGGCGGNADAWHLSTDTLEKAGKPELVRDIEMYAILVSRLLRSDVLPHDHARNVERQAIVEDYDELAGDAFDFSPTLTHSTTSPTMSRRSTMPSMLARSNPKPRTRRSRHSREADPTEFRQRWTVRAGPGVQSAAVSPLRAHVAVRGVRRGQGRAPIPAGRPAASTTERRGLRAFQAPRPASELTGSREPPTQSNSASSSSTPSPGPSGTGISGSRAMG